MLSTAEILEGPWEKPERTMIHENLTDGEVYCRTTNPEDIRQANELEARVWEQKGYGSTEPNRKYDGQSSLYVAKDSETGDVIAGVRVFHIGEHDLPFVSEMKIDNKSTEAVVRVLMHRGLVEEVGILFRDEARTTPAVTALNLNRLAYRDATERGVGYWGIVMEPDRVKRMNRYRGYAFNTLGGTTDYQGGDCAGHIMKLATVRRRMRIFRPRQYKWFTAEPLSSEIET